MRIYRPKLLIFILGFIIITSLGYGGYRYALTVKELKATKNNFENKVKQLEADLSRAQNENTNLTNSLVAERIFRAPTRDNHRYYNSGSWRVIYKI